MSLEKQILSLYEESALPAHEISHIMQVEEEVVKLVLNNKSKQYAEGHSKEEDITVDEKNAIIRELKNIALYGGEEHIPTRAKTLKFLYEEAIGRNSAKIGKLGGVKINILQINEGLAKAKEAVRKSLEEPTILVTEEEQQVA